MTCLFGTPRRGTCRRHRVSQSACLRCGLQAARATASPIAATSAARTRSARAMAGLPVHHGPDASPHLARRSAFLACRLRWTRATASPSRTRIAPRRARKARATASPSAHGFEMRSRDRVRRAARSPRVVTRPPHSTDRVASSPLHPLARMSGVPRAQISARREYTVGDRDPATDWRLRRRS